VLRHFISVVEFLELLSLVDIVVFKLCPFFKVIYLYIIAFPVFQCYKYIPTGTNAMTKVIRDELILQTPELGNDAY
jgi:hypothetical protein